MEIVNNCIVDRITTVYLDPDEMEAVNSITGLSPFNEVNFVDYSVFEIHPELIYFLENIQELFLLKSKQVDYIVFRLDI